MPVSRASSPSVEARGLVGGSDAVTNSPTTPSLLLLEFRLISGQYDPFGLHLLVRRRDLHTGHDRGHVCAVGPRTAGPCHDTHRTLRPRIPVCLNRIGVWTVCDFHPGDAAEFPKLQWLLELSMFGFYVP